MANIQLFSLKGSQSHPGFVDAVVQFTGTFTVDEWNEFQARFHAMRTRGKAKPSTLPEGCIEAEIVPPPRYLS